MCAVLRWEWFCRQKVTGDSRVYYFSHHSTVYYDKRIHTLQQLYVDLKNTDPEHILNLSIFHRNIASLTKHVDELQPFKCLDHPFDIIGISETRLHYVNPLTNVEIDGYKFCHTPSKSQGGGGMVFM